MKDYVIITDSTTDLPAEIANELGLIVMSLKFQIAGKEYTNYLDEREMSSKEFYDLIRQGNMPTTSQVNVNEYIEVMTPILESGKDIFVMCFDSKLSGTYNSLCVARNMLLEEFPDANIVAYDTLAACTGEGVFVYNAVLKKNEGYSMEELKNWCDENRLKVNHWFTVDDIDHLKRGGRLTNAAAFAAKLLKIKPFLVCNDEGKLIVKKKCIGRKNAILTLYEKFVENYDEESEIVFVTHSDTHEEAEFLANKIKNESGKKIKKLVINNMGPVIGAHVGPGTLCVFYMGVKDTREY